MMMMFTPERHLPTSGQHGPAPSGTPPPATAATTTAVDGADTHRENLSTVESSLKLRRWSKWPPQTSNFWKTDRRRSAAKNGNPRMP